MSSSGPGKKPLKPKSSARRSKEEREALDREESERRDAQARAAAADAETERARENAQYLAFSRGQSERGGPQLKGKAVVKEDDDVRKARIEALQEKDGKQRDGNKPSFAGYGSESKGKGQGTLSGANQSAPGVTSESSTHPELQLSPKTSSKKKMSSDKDEDSDAGVEVSSTKPRAKKDKPEDVDQPYASSSDENLPSVNIDDADAYNQTSTAGLGRLPIRPHRVRHVEHAIGVNTESSAATATGSKRDTKKESVGTKVESEPEDEAEGVNDNEPEGQDSDAAAATATAIQQAEARRRRVNLFMKDRQHMPNYKDVDNTEFKSLERKADKMLKILGHTEDKTKERCKDNMYLFQIPPNMPSLVPVGAEVKKEPDNDEDIPDAPAEVNIKQENNEDEDEVIIKSEDGPTGQKLPSFEESLPKRTPGKVGKLRVHKSGRTTLDWGGITHNVAPGTNLSVAHSLLMADIPKDNQRDDRFSGDAAFLGTPQEMLIVSINNNVLLQKH
ncbi:MAG: hypothetical protein M1831_004294 [Alyxoria varia]|nr:MAG: hypothetical protein M1831_004294 [Alyxoria varia]